MSKYDEQAGVRQLAEALTHELLDLGIAIDLIGHVTAGRLGINQTDLICLNLLSRNGPMATGQVARALGLTGAAISAMATRLEKGGYARREIDPKDRRRVLLHPSPEGAQRALGVFDEFYEATATLYASYDPKDLGMLVDLLGRFRQIIADYTASLRDAAAPSGEPPASP